MSTPGERSADAFKRFDAWRNHPMLKPTGAQLLPGFRLGAAAAAVYLDAEYLMNKASGKSAHGHGHGDVKGHH